MELDITHSMENDIEYNDNSSESKFIACSNNEQFSVLRISEDVEPPEPKASKHSSRKQSKRRKKSSSHSRPLPRIIVKPLPPPPPEPREWTAAAHPEPSSYSTKLSTMREVLASIPGFSMKPRKPRGKKLSTAAQLQQTKEGWIDLETPDSILVNTNIRALLNKHTFSLLPPLYQYKLGQLLPSVDRPSTSGRLSSSSLNNEFFARACLEWQECLSGGEFTPENQQKIKTEAEKEKSKIDPWKLKHFEPFWGDKLRKEKPSMNLNSERPSLKTTIKLRPTASITSSSTVSKVKKSKSSSTSKRLRSVGAVTRSSTKTDDAEDEPTPVPSKSSAPVPDLLPLKHAKNHNRGYVECQVDFNFSDSSSVQRMDDSVSSTPIDPLLLPDCDSENSEIKEDLDITVVTIEESSTSKDCDEDKAIDSNSNLTEATKRLSDDSDASIYPKRFKYEENDYAALGKTEESVDQCQDDASSNCEVVSNTCTDETVNQSNDNEHTPEEDHVDAKTEEDKELKYEDITIEPCNSSIQVENSHSNMLNEYTTKSPIKHYTDTTNDDEYRTQGDDDLQRPPVPNPNDQTFDEEHMTEKLPLLNNTQDSYDHYQSNSNPDVENSEPKMVLTMLEPINSEKVEPCDVAKDETYQPAEHLHNMEYESQQQENDDKCHVKNLSEHTVVQSFYDEHFRDAESLIMETGGLSLLPSQNEDPKFPPITPHANLMELSSYMSETNVTAVVTMPMTQSSSLPMMEVSNSAMVSYPDDHMQDPAKPKNAVWKTESDWSSNENIMTYSNSDNSKYMCEDSKTSMEDGNMNDENCLIKDDRDANFNMECSNSSESCQSMKETSLGQSELAPGSVGAPAVNLASNTSVTHHSRSSSNSRHKSKSGKETSRSRSSNKVPPGAVNLERSYQICQAVIQNSPNRDALRGQLRPPPALLARPARAAARPPPVVLRQLPVAVVPHNEVNENRPNNVGQYILVQRTPAAAPRASSAPPSNQNTNVSVARCRSVGADEACVCNLRAMILCKKCGAFCHDDCIGSADLCLTCLIR
ncbi:hypothetical protein JYU34_002752 [Plutella xylostella]|uniref:DEUBAD domain-containing protein n=1 Tax=Plutella xylostella TaxID=51655 RepID=A0ABQ7R335_PLUXY|nr:hypothetical protein JYU34_002752 [Plutella xylostella]